jgi:predicted membrane-bound spermidine synthase
LNHFNESRKSHSTCKTYLLLDYIEDGKSMIKISIGLFCVALTTLMLELNLVRVFDVIWYSNMAYMVITLAMFCFGLSGIYSSLFPRPLERDVHGYLAVLSFLFALFSLAVLPALNWIPFDFNVLYTSPVKAGFLFLVMYLFLIIPFFLAGLIFTTVFSHYADKIQSLYCWDLSGASLGCLVLIPFLPSIGPGGIMFLACSFGLVAAGCFSQKKAWTLALIALAVIVAIIPFSREGYFEFKDHIDKRGVKGARERNLIEDVHWDPISKIEVIDFGKMKHIAYDGGSQSSYIIPFNGDFTALREDIKAGRGYHFYGSSVYVSHALKKDTGHEVLVIGAAGGSETKAALMYGASHVDAVELVGYVIDIGKDKYAAYNGQIFNHPNVNALKGEGRSFLRSSNRSYDVIQMYSNHTSSSIAAGTGAMATTYLQTVEAYKEYYTHLKDDGILHINHHVYPKMVATAARAWKELGREDFLKHIVVLEAVKQGFQDNLPTMLIKMKPWTEAELAEVRTHFHPVIKMVVHPLQPEDNMLTDEFFSGNLEPQTIDAADYRIAASTDDRPYFNFLRKSFAVLEEDPENYLNYSTASLLNSQLKNGWIPTDVVHLIVTGGASLFFIVMFIFVPMCFSRVGREKWGGKINSLVYFSCLGAGFIIFELIFIQIFMKLIGYPLYTYSTIVFATLISAGVGSAISGKMGVSPNRRWSLPFIGVLICSFFIVISYESYSTLFMQTPTIVRIAAATALIFPLGFFLGMPFPLGILTIARQPRGAIAWAWAMNGLFTVVGGLGSVLLSILLGFRLTVIVAMLIYLLAFLVFSRLRLITEEAA